MTIGEWNPAGSKKTVVEIDMGFLQHIVDMVSENDAHDVTAMLDASQISQGAVLMTLDQDSWDSIGAWDDRKIELLIRFFTIDEMQLPGWRAGHK